MVGDFVFFSSFFRISGIQGFLGSVPAPRDHKLRPCWVTRFFCLPCIDLVAPSG